MIAKFIKYACSEELLPFFLFALLGILLITVRIAFDAWTYCLGSTRYCYGISQSGYDYLFHLPPGYHDFDGPRPLLIYLHGAGETKIGLDELAKRDIISCTKDCIDKKDFPFVVLSPETPIHGWKPERVVRLLDEILADRTNRWNIDRKRIYLTGMSMGAFGTFHTACAFPDRFAAIAPLAGGGNPEEAPKLKNLPTWAFHGNADEIVAYECSSKMIEAMNNIQCVEAKLETLEGAGHGIMCDVYSNPNLFRWLLKHQMRVTSD